jgi:hypothetical protein
VKQNSFGCCLDSESPDVAQGTEKMKTQHVAPKREYISTRLHGGTPQTVTIFRVTAVRTSNLNYYYFYACRLQTFRTYLFVSRVPVRTRLSRAATADSCD